MERSEPALVPEWLRSTGSVTGVGSSSPHFASSSLHSGTYSPLLEFISVVLTLSTMFKWSITDIEDLYSDLTSLGLKGSGEFLNLTLSMMMLHLCVSLLQMLLYPHCLLAIDLREVLVTKIAHVLCFWIAVHHQILGVALVELVRSIRTVVLIEIIVIKIEKERKKDQVLLIYGIMTHLILWGTS